MNRNILAIVLLAALSQNVRAGEIYRCTTASGEVIYTNIGCPEKAKVQHVASYVPEAYSPKQAEELAAEAAAISARQAQEGAERAQAAAYQAAQASYRQAEPETEPATYSPGGFAGYPVYYPSRSRHDDRQHEHRVGGKSAPPPRAHPTAPMPHVSRTARKL